MSFENALDKGRDLFGFDKEYTRRSIWSDTGNIVTRDSTRRQMSRLTLGILCSNTQSATVANAMATPDDKISWTIGRLIDLGYSEIQSFWSDYTRERERHFRRTYKTSNALDQEEIDILRRAQDDQDREMKDIEEGRLLSGQEDRPFDELVKRHLVEEFERAELQLRDVLSLEKHIVGADLLEEDEPEDE